jgi:hypothetical protein
MMSGWCLGNLVRLTARERLFCLLAASLPDLDGLGLLVSQEAYWEYHHQLGHNLFFGILLTGVLTAFSSDRLKTGAIYLGLFHLHLVLDYFGSGEGWEIFYLWPVADWAVENPHAWPFYSWQNIGTGLACLVWVLAIAVRAGRTPLETVLPKLDAQLVQWLRRRTRHGV